MSTRQGGGQGWFWGLVFLLLFGAGLVRYKDLLHDSTETRRDLLGLTYAGLIKRLGEPRSVWTGRSNSEANAVCTATGGPPLPDNEEVQIFVWKYQAVPLADFSRATLLSKGVPALLAPLDTRVSVCLVGSDKDALSWAAVRFQEGKAF